MTNQIAWRLVSPMIFLSGVLLAIGGIAAWSVHSQQQASSDALLKEVNSLLAIESAQIEMREIRYQINMFLRSLDLKRIREVSTYVDGAAKRVEALHGRSNSAEEQRLIEQITAGYDQFSREFHQALMAINSANQDDSKVIVSDNTVALETMSYLADDLLTSSVLHPIERCVEANKRAMNEHNAALLSSAKQLMHGLLLLGICGGGAGILTGWVVGRGLGRSMIQLSVSLQDAAVKLSDARGMITLTRHSDLNGLQVAVNSLANDISHVVEQLQQRERELLRSEQLGQVGQLAAGMAHELRNPLMPIKMLVQAAMEKPSGGLTGKSLEVLDHEISRLEKSIQSFLDFARPPSPEKSVVRILDTVRGIAFLVNGRCIQQGVTFSIDQTEQDLELVADRNQIYQLLLNLVLNALDEQPHGGSIQVKVNRVVAISRLENNAEALEEKDDATKIISGLSVNPQSAEHWVQIHVWDDGPGISPEILPKLFQPFATTKETGMGLGLATCERIARSHGGRIEARNRKEGGTMFTVTLPCETAH